MCYLISAGELIAVSSEQLTSGSCKFGFIVAKEQMNANFERVLVNSRTGHVSNAKKWAAKARECQSYFKPVDKNLNRDFIVSDYAAV